MPKVIHFDMEAKDVKRAIDFYKKTFGWKFEKWDGPFDYWLIEAGKDDEPGIGGGLSQSEGSVASIINTIGVDSLDSIIEKITKNGGKIVNPKHVVPGVGYMATFEDTEGNQFGVMQEDESAH
jgi:predicted enzyme related to lactoylglutathione lyase